MRERRVTDWIRDHALGIGPTWEECLEAADLKLHPAGFDRLRHNRLLLGTLRYEACGTGYYDAIGSAAARLEAYQLTGNRELLVDIVNLCAIEWLRPIHQNAHWDSVEDHGMHAEEI